jgi:hypothetical protein
MEATEHDEQSEREHLEGLERVRHGLPYSGEQFRRELRILEDLHQHEQRAMRVYTDYTFTVLMFSRELELEIQQEWNNALLHVFEQEACRTIVWGCDLKHPRRVLVLFGKYHSLSRPTEHH